MNRQSKRFTTTPWARRMIAGLLILLTIVLVGTLLFLLVSISGLWP
jgi:hypothetical protein